MLNLKLVILTNLIHLIQNQFSEIKKLIFISKTQKISFRERYDLNTNENLITSGPMKWLNKELNRAHTYKYAYIYIHAKSGVMHTHMRLFSGLSLDYFFYLKANRIN